MSVLDFFSIKKVHDEVSNKVMDLSQLLTAKQKELARMQGMPMSKADIKSLVADFIKSQAATYPEKLIPSLDRFIQNRTDYARASASVDKGNLRLASAGITDDPRYGSVHDMQPFLCFVFGDQILESINKAIDAASFGDDGVNAKQWAQKHDKLTQEVRQLDQDLKKLLKEARESGLDL